MDVIEWLMDNGEVLDGTVIAHVVFLAIIIELFGICSYWLRRFN